MRKAKDNKDGPYDLQRFVDAQDLIYEELYLDLKQGYKTGHWMWFVFPQIAGLGRSMPAKKFAISSLKEAEAYLKHPVLGPRLRACTKLVTDLEGRSINQIFGYIDCLKFRSSMTLFTHATVDNEIFKRALSKYFGGEFDRLTLNRLE